MKRSHHSLGRHRRRKRIELPILSADLLGVAGERVILLGERWRLLERLDQQLAAKLMQTDSKRAIGVLRRNWLAPLKANGPAVQTCGDPHYRHAGHLVTRNDRALDRCRASPPR